MRTIGDTIETLYEYDNVNNIIKQVTTGETNFALEYEYDALDRMISEVRTEGETTTTSSYAYDKLSRIATFAQVVDGDLTETETYKYDAVGNITQKFVGETRVRMTYGKTNELLTMRANGKTIDYDYNQNGDLTCKTLINGKSKLQDQYSYDSFGNLAGYDGYDGYSQRLSSVMLGLRVEKRVTGDANRLTLEELLVGKKLDNSTRNGILEVVESGEQGDVYNEETRFDAWTTTRYLQDITTGYGVVLSETTETNANPAEKLVTSYEYGLERLSGLTTAGSDRTADTRTLRSEYVYDARGSVAQSVEKSNNVEILTQSNSEISSLIDIHSFSYTPFGELSGAKSSGYRFNGEEYDAATGMLNLRVRQYEPAMMRFSQMDLVRGDVAKPITLNRYVYCYDEPVGFVDPSGMLPSFSDILAGLAGAVVGGIAGYAAGGVAGAIAGAAAGAVAGAAASSAAKKKKSSTSSQTAEPTPAPTQKTDYSAYYPFSPDGGTPGYNATHQPPSTKKNTTSATATLTPMPSATSIGVPYPFNPDGVTPGYNATHQPAMGTVNWESPELIYLTSFNNLEQQLKNSQLNETQRRIIKQAQGDLMQQIVSGASVIQLKSIYQKACADVANAAGETAPKQSILGYITNFGSDIKNMAVSIWNGFGERTDKMTASSTAGTKAANIFNWLFLGIPGAIYENNKANGYRMINDPSFYTFGNWLSSGSFDMAKSAVTYNYDHPLEQWLSSAGLISEIYGIYKFAQTNGWTAELKAKLNKTLNSFSKFEIIDGKVLGKIPLDDYLLIHENSLHNVSSNTLTLGRFAKDESSYIARAGETMYFDLGDMWGTIEKIYDLTDDDMFNLFNVSALDKALNSNMIIRFSHNPIAIENARTALSKEWNYIKNIKGIDDSALIKIGDYWYVK